MKCMLSQLSQPHFLLPTYSGLRFLASEATDPEHCVSISVPCFLMLAKFVVNFVEIPTEVRIHDLLSDACSLDTCCVDE